jgi:hypothetical protein
MLQRVAIQYMRGYEGKSISAWVKRGSDEYTKYKEGESDRKNGLLNYKNLKNKLKKTWKSQVFFLYLLCNK